MTQNERIQERHIDMNKKTLTYADAGVNIDTGNRFIQAIMPLAQATSRTGTKSQLGDFGGLFDIKACGFKDPILVAANDGVGTKLKIAIETNQHDTIGIDLVAMSVNDLIVQGAEPLFFLDYFACGQLNIKTAQSVVQSIAKGCLEAGCSLLGGETAEMPDMYHNNDYDLAGFAVGAVERDKLLPHHDINEGNILLGLASHGIHANGFSLIRRLVAQNNLDWHSRTPWGDSTLVETLLQPTRIYVKSILATLHETDAIRALCHITGGGFQENIPRILPDNLTAEIDLSTWDIPPVFNWIKQQAHLSTSELLRTFNCGIGMVVVIDSHKKKTVIDKLTEYGETVTEIGHLTARKDKQVTFKPNSLYQK